MSEVIIEDPVWQAIISDPQLANVRRKLSFHEIRLIVRHAQGAPQRPLAQTLAERVMQAHEWGYRDPVVGGFVEDRLPFDLAEAVLAMAKPDAP